MDLTYEQLAKFEAPKPTPVEVPEWKATVYVRPLTALEFDRLAVSDDKESGRIRAVALAMVNADGSPFWPEHLARTDHGQNMLAKQSHKAIDRIWEVVARQNGYGGEDLAGNSNGTEGAASASS